MHTLLSKAAVAFFETLLSKAAVDSNHTLLSKAAVALFGTPLSKAAVALFDTLLSKAAFDSNDTLLSKAAVALLCTLLSKAAVDCKHTVLLEGMRGPVGPGHRSNAPGPRWARASVNATWVGFTGVTGASANRGPVGPALRRCETVPWSVGPLHPP